MIDTFETVVEAAEEALAAAVPAALRGRAPDLDDVELLREVADRVDEGSPLRRRCLLLVAHGRTLPARVSAAREQDEAPIQLADGSALDLDTAERRLADKEDKRAFAPLRAALDDAAHDGRASERAAEHELHDFAHGETGTRWPDVDEEEARELLAIVEPALVDVGNAAAAAVFVEAPDGADWARALELPDGPTFTTDASRALSRAMLEAAGGAPVRAMKAPRALAGWAARLPDGPRAAVVPGFGAGRAHRTLAAVGRALAMELPGASPGGRATDALGEAAALALGGAAGRRAVLSGSREDARRAQRAVTIACALRSTLLAAACRALAEGGELLEAAESANQAAGEALPDAVVHDLLRGGFPDGRAASRLGGMLRELERTLMGAHAARVLRDRFDEDWPLRTDAWEALRHEPVDERRAALGEPAEWMTAYVEAASELL